jgi:hypothetical protein
VTGPVVAPCLFGGTLESTLTAATIRATKVTTSSSSGFTTTGIGTLALAGCGSLFCALETNIRLCNHERGLLLMEKGRQQAVSYLLISFVGNSPQILHLLCGRRGCLRVSFGCLFQMLVTLSQLQGLSMVLLRGGPGVFSPFWVFFGEAARDMVNLR